MSEAPRSVPPPDNVTAFSRYIGINYSGAKTPTDGLDGLRVYVAGGDAEANEVQLPLAGC